MDNQMNEAQMSILDQIVQAVAREVFDKWSDSLPEDQKTEEMMNNLSKNSYDLTIYVVQSFMDKFNAAASNLSEVAEN